MNEHLLLQKAAKIKLLILDVDGVLTTGQLFFTAKGEEIKVFHVLDGCGIKTLLLNGIEVAIISGRESLAVSCRMEELGVKHVYQGQNDKGVAFAALKRKLNLSSDKQIAYVGDDIPDLDLIKQVGFGVVVANGVEEMKPFADYVTQATGGKGAVREVCDLILRAKEISLSNEKP